jgi:hypothetical protein
MSDIRSLLENLDRIDEAQNHEFLNTIVDRYAGRHDSRRFSCYGKSSL